MKVHRSQFIPRRGGLLVPFSGEFEDLIDLTGQTLLFNLFFEDLQFLLYLLIHVRRLFQVLPASICNVVPRLIPRLRNGSVLLLHKALEFRLV